MPGFRVFMATLVVPFQVPDRRTNQGGEKEVCEGKDRRRHSYREKIRTQHSTMCVRVCACVYLCVYLQLYIINQSNFYPRSFHLCINSAADELIKA